jgi:cytochrome b6-f complex iron-sulfur subunit
VKKVAKAPPPPVPPRPVRQKAEKAAKAGVSEERRTFLVVHVGVVHGDWVHGTFGYRRSVHTRLSAILFPNVLAEPPSRFKVGSKEGFPAGKVETKYVAQYGVWVVNSDFEGVQQIYALKTVCTHLGCTPNWLEAEQKFKCPCHGSGFYKDGINFEGPAPRPLERYAIRIADDGQLEVDKSKSFQEELGQWNDPESFVTA